MIDAQNATYKSAIAPAAIIDNAAATGIAIDTKGASYAEVMVQLGATDIGLTVCKLTECDTSGGTYTDVSGGDFDGDTDVNGTTLVLPSATDDGQTIVWQCDMVGKKRYLKVAITFGDGSAGGFVAGVARLSRLANNPPLSTDIATGGVARV